MWRQRRSRAQSTDARNSEGNCALHWACLNGHIEVVRLLMERGASAAVLNAAGRTPVDEALSRGFTEVFDLIREYGTAGADVAVEIEDGQEGEEDDDDEEGMQEDKAGA